MVHTHAVGILNCADLVCKAIYCTGGYFNSVWPYPCHISQTSYIISSLTNGVLFSVTSGILGGRKDLGKSLTDLTQPL